jgi:hypothetical protein
MMARAFKWGWACLVFAISAAGFFGLPVPRTWGAAVDWLTSTDLWVINHAAYPSLFALAVGLLSGTIVVPSVWEIIRRFLVRTHLECTFDPAHRLCDLQTHFTGSGIRARYFRLRVQTIHANAMPLCIGRLTAIGGPGGENNLQENLRLPFAPSEWPDAGAKLILNGAPEYLDALVITENHEIIIPAYGGMPNAVVVNDIFNATGRYQITIRVTSPLSRFVERRLELDWTGNWLTSSMRAI